MMKNRKNIVAQDDDLVCAFADVVIFEIALVPTMAIATMETNEDADSGATIKLDAQLQSKEQNIILVLMEDSCVFQMGMASFGAVDQQLHRYHTFSQNMILNTFVYVCIYRYTLVPMN